MVETFVNNLLFCKYIQYNINCNNSINGGTMVHKL